MKLVMLYDKFFFLFFFVFFFRQFLNSQQQEVISTSGEIHTKSVEYNRLCLLQACTMLMAHNLGYQYTDILI